MPDPTPHIPDATPAVIASNGLVLSPDAVRIVILRKELQLLERQAKALQARLLQLCPELHDGMAPVCTPVSELREANERLVLAALDARCVAEAVVTRLGELTRRSQRDALSGTPNRLLMLDRLQGAMALARRRGTPMAVLFIDIDIDHVKTINDVRGHAVGDAVLQRTAQRMEAVVRESDTVRRQAQRSQPLRAVRRPWRQEERSGSAHHR